MKHDMTENFTPSKWVFTNADFESMSWHDNALRGIAIPSGDDELAFDLDYIFKWIEPKVEDGFYQFWIAPVTLLFSRAHEIRSEIRSVEKLLVDLIVRSDSVNKRPTNTYPEWLWTIDCNDGDISFLASGFRQFTRKLPVLSSAHYLSMEERGGICFDTPEQPSK